MAKEYNETGKMNVEDRFTVRYMQGTMDVVRILVDRETGVNYLQTYYGNAGGITVLLDRDGKIGALFGAVKHGQNKGNIYGIA